MNSWFNEELSRWFKDVVNCNIVNGMLLGELTKDTFHKIKFYESFNADKYPGILVEIFNKTTGKLDGVCFDFDDYSNDGKHYYIWNDRGDIDWYKDVPDEELKGRLIEAVFEYLAMWEG